MIPDNVRRRREALEALLDASYFPDGDPYGLVHDLLQDLRRVCAGKADHVNSVWQDGPLAKAWEREMRLAHRALVLLESRPAPS